MGIRQEDENTGPIWESRTYLADRGYSDPKEVKRKFRLANATALLVEARGFGQSLAKPQPSS